MLVLRHLFLLGQRVFPIPVRLQGYLSIEMAFLVQLSNCLMCNFLTIASGTATSVSFAVTLGTVPMLKFPVHRGELKWYFM